MRPINGSTENVVIRGSFPPRSSRQGYFPTKAPFTSQNGVGFRAASIAIPALVKTFVGLFRGMIRAAPPGINLRYSPRIASDRDTSMK